MSYSLQLYELSLDQLTQTIGGKHPEMLSKIQGSTRVRELDTERQSELVATLRSLIGGEKSASANQSLGYALELLCLEIGEAVPCEVDGVDSMFMDEVARKIKWVKHLTRARPLGGMPKLKGFPVVGHMTALEIVAAKADWDEEKLDRMDEDLAACATDLFAALESTRDGKDLVSFFY